MANSDDVSKISELEVVELREVWPNEAADFTHWLANEENLKSLGKALGIDLELAKTEVGVGDFRADIVCTANGDEPTVLIENQLTNTDHRHLGQTLTYAAGLGAVTVIWIARQFRDEHRAAIDWLNQITAEQFSFFGVEVKLWRVDASRPAHQFLLVSKPNDWRTTISKTANGEISEANLRHQRFWESLNEGLKDRGRTVRARRPSPSSRAHFSIGRTGFGLRASRNHQKNQLHVALRVYRQDSHAHYKLLELEKEDIVERLGGDTEWIEQQPGKNGYLIQTSKPEVSIDDEDDWENQVEWFIEKLQLFHDVFSTRVRRLDASEWTPEDDLSDE